MANLITSIRIICSIALLFCPVLSTSFYALYIVVGITDMLYIAFQRCSSTVKKQHTDTDFRAVLAALFSFVQVAVFEPNFF